VKGHTSIDSNRSTEGLQFVATPTLLLFVVVQYVQISTGAVVDSHVGSYLPWGLHWVTIDISSRTVRVRRVASLGGLDRG
jgi:hypothetical protein